MRTFLFFVFVLNLISCSLERQVNRSAEKNVLNDPALKTAHVGISIYDPATNQYVYNYQGDKYFVPASNVKIPTCYAAMKYLGDSLVGMKVVEDEHTIEVSATADPTFLHEDFKIQNVYEFLKHIKKEIYFTLGHWKENAWGSGWSWSDYDASYLSERSAFPLYGNVVTFTGTLDTLRVTPSFFAPDIRNKDQSKGYISNVNREFNRNVFTVLDTGSALKKIQVPFITSGVLNSQLLEDSLHLRVHFIPTGNAPRINLGGPLLSYVIRSQPTDSLLKPMMHRSDNFFAEQTLLMVSNEMLGLMNDEKIIDTLLKTVLNDLPQKPRWVDGSGLSRYNLFTPQSIVSLLNKMRKEFGMERVQNILPTGNEGTLTNYYNADSGFIYAKTGTLSGVVALSGFLFTKKSKLLLFSILVNNHQASASSIRRAIEKFIKEVRKRY